MKSQIGILASVLLACSAIMACHASAPEPRGASAVTQRHELPASRPYDVSDLSVCMECLFIGQLDVGDVDGAAPTQARAEFNLDTTAKKSGVHHSVRCSPEDSLDNSDSMTVAKPCSDDWNAWMSPSPQSEKPTRPGAPGRAWLSVSLDDFRDQHGAMDNTAGWSIAADPKNKRTAAAFAA